MKGISNRSPGGGPVAIAAGSGCRAHRRLSATRWAGTMACSWRRCDPRIQCVVSKCGFCSFTRNTSRATWPGWSHDSYMPRIRTAVPSSNRKSIPFEFPKRWWRPSAPRPFRQAPGEGPKFQRGRRQGVGRPRPENQGTNCTRPGERPRRPTCPIAATISPTTFARWRMRG